MYTFFDVIIHLIFFIYKGGEFTLPPKNKKFALHQKLTNFSDIPAADKPFRLNVQNSYSRCPLEKDVTLVSVYSKTLLLVENFMPFNCFDLKGSNEMVYYRNYKGV